MEIEEFVGFDSGGGGEVMFGVGIASLEGIGFPEEVVDRLSGRDAVAHAADFEVGIF